MDTTTTRMSGLLDELERENARLTRENGILAAKNAAQSDMLREAVKAAAEWQSERDALQAALSGMPKYRLGQKVVVGDWTTATGTIEEISIIDEGVIYRVYVEGESMVYTWPEKSVNHA